MIFGIASYHRPECRTIRTLLDAGVNKSDIVVSTQTEQDYALYKKRHSGIEIIYADKDCAGGNRNSILDYLNSPVLLLDDDVCSFGKYKKNYSVSTELVLREIENAVKGRIEAVIGISPTNNSIVRANRDNETRNCLLQGTVLYFNDSSVRFDERWKMVEDYELSLRLISKKKMTLRLNDYVANKPQNGTNAGGLHDRYANNELAFWIKMLNKKYPNFIPNKSFTGGRIK